MIPRGLRSRWPAVAGPGTQALAEDLLARYAEPHRRYHDQRHLADVLDALDLLGAGDTATLAAWYHDAVYDPRRDDNEERSAALAVEHLAGRLPQPRVSEVARLVWLTATHDPAGDDRDGAVLCDADLAILGSEPARYAGYASAVRAEYAHVPDGDFARGRAAILRDLLARDPLYRSATGRSRWEASARTNLSRELTGLAASGWGGAGRPRAGRAGRPGAGRPGPEEPGDPSAGAARQR